MAQRFRPNEARLTALGYRSIAHVPVVLASDGRYMREINWYLRERATLAWPESLQLKLANGRPIKYPRTQALLKIADSLVNFSDWLEARSYDWRRIQYTSLRLYAKEQREGRWSGVGHSVRRRFARMRESHMTALSDCVRRPDRMVNVFFAADDPRWRVRRGQPLPRDEAANARANEHAQAQIGAEVPFSACRSGVSLRS
jgi:hypothetical protein